MLPELREPFDRLDRAWSELERTVIDLPDEAVAFRPGEGWSIHQVVDHMQLVEGAFLDMMRRSEGRGPRRRSWARSLGLRAVRLLFRLGLRVSIPRGAEAMRPSADVAVDQLFERARAARDNARDAFAALEPADLSRSAAKHPVGGALDFREALWFVEGHFGHHLRQIERIRSHGDFPT